MGAWRQLAWLQSEPDWMLYWTAHGIKAVRGPLVSASDSCSCASEDGSQETAHIQGKVFSVSLYAALLLVCLLFYFNPVIVLPIIFLFNSYIPRHRRYASSFKHFPTWLPVSGCSKQCLLKDLCVDTIIIQQRISGKTIVFNEGIWGSNEILKNFVDDYTSYRRSNILYSHQCTFFSNSCQIISNILLVCKVMPVY